MQQLGVEFRVFRQLLFTGEIFVIITTLLDHDFHPPVASPVLGAVVGHHGLGVGKALNGELGRVHVAALHQFMGHGHRPGGGQLPVGTEATGGNGQVVGMTFHRIDTLHLLDGIADLIHDRHEV